MFRANAGRRDGLFGTQQAEVNVLNVFPVPDGDTGTNMTMTLSAARRDLGDACRTSLGEVDEAVPGRVAGGPGQLGRHLVPVFARFRARACPIGRPRGPKSWPRPWPRAPRRLIGPSSNRWKVRCLPSGKAPPSTARRGRGQGRGSWPACLKRRCKGPRRRWPARRTCCRCWPKPASSTRAGKGSCIS